MSVKRPPFKFHILLESFELFLICNASSLLSNNYCEVESIFGNGAQESQDASLDELNARSDIMKWFSYALHFPSVFDLYIGSHQEEIVS